MDVAEIIFDVRDVAIVDDTLGEETDDEACLEPWEVETSEVLGFSAVEAFTVVEPFTVDPPVGDILVVEPECELLITDETFVENVEMSEQTGAEVSSRFCQWSGIWCGSAHHWSDDTGFAPSATHTL